MCNPIHQILSDDLYQMMLDLNLINRKVLRDLKIKRAYVTLRKEGAKATEAIEVILSKYPYLQFDTVRKIIYSVKLPEEIRHSD